MAKLILSVSLILRVVIFFLSIIYKPLYQLLLINDRIITLAFIMSGTLNRYGPLGFYLIVILPFFYFSTLTYTLVITFTSNIMVLLALIATSDDMEIVYEIFVTMIILAIMILKFDEKITRVFWNEVRLDHGNQDFNKVLNNSSQCILIYSRETKSLLF